MKRLSDQTLYEIIEVSEAASPAEIERACDRAAATYGPGSLVTYTLASTEETALLSSRIEEARAVLLDADARARYDERIGIRPPSQALDQAAAPPTPPEPFPMPTAWPSAGQEPGYREPRQLAPGLPPAAPIRPPAEPAPAEAAAPAPARLAPIPLTAAVAPPPIPLTRPAGPILLQREVVAPADPQVPEGGAWTGGMLRRVRESRGLTMQQVAERTRITRHHLENIEADRFQALPAPVYLRGIIMSLARELRLDGQKVARSYLERMGPGADGGPGR